MSTGNKNTARAIFLSLLRRNRYTFNLTTSRCIRDKFISNTTEVLRVITFYVIRDTRANYKSRTIDINFGTICCCAPTFGQACLRMERHTKKQQILCTAAAIFRRRCRIYAGIIIFFLKLQFFSWTFVVSDNIDIVYYYSICRKYTIFSIR